MTHWIHASGVPKALQGVSFPQGTSDTLLKSESLIQTQHLCFLRMHETHALSVILVLPSTFLMSIPITIENLSFIYGH